MIARLLLLLQLVVFAAAPAATATYTTIANRDSHLRQDSPGSNFGSATELEIRASSGDNRRPVIGFNLPAIPTGEIIVSATLQLYVTTGTAGGTVNIHRVTSSWTEGGVTWSNTSADFNPTAETSLAVNALGAVSFDITALVRGWANGTIANNGVMAITNTANGRFASSENGTTSQRPRLVINTVVAPVLTVDKTSTLISDPWNGSANPKSIPGSVVRYTISVSNSANGTADSGTTEVIETVPPDMKLYVGDLGGPGSGPIVFTNGSPSSGLTYTFISLASTADSISFSNNGGASYTYTPNPGGDGYDANVTHLRVNPSGSFAANSGSGNPSFTLTLRMQVE